MRLLAQVLFLATLALLIGFPPADAKEKAKEKKKVELKVKVGDAAPAFDGFDEAGKEFKSSNVVGKKVVVLFFYPSDFTGNGVAQARGFQDEMENLTKQGVVVVGVSGDSASTHKLFKAYYKLTYPLLADEKGEVAKAFGVPVGPGGKSPTINAKDEKGSADRGVTLDFVTIVIDKAGKIAAADRVGKAGDEAKRVAKIVEKLDTK